VTNSRLLHFIILTQAEDQQNYLYHEGFEFSVCFTTVLRIVLLILRSV